MIKQIVQYFAKHPHYNGTVHVLVGIGIGMLLTYPLAGTHPVRFGLAFLALGILGHLYPLMVKK